MQRCRGQHQRRRPADRRRLERHLSEPLPAYANEELARLDTPELWRLLIRNEDRVPRNVIDECARRGDAILDEIEAALHKEYYWGEDVGAGELWLPMHATMVLGLIANERAGNLLIGYLRRITELGDDILEDYTSGFWPALFRNKPESVISALRALGEDRSQHWSARASAIPSVMAYAELSAPDTLEQTLDWAAAIAFRDGEDLAVRALVGSVLLDFARPRHRSDLSAVAKTQPRATRIFDLKEIEAVYAAGGREREWQEFLDPWAFYSPEAIAERQRAWAEAEAEAAMQEPGVTYVREAAKVGRNDPCPCGSGKKYKKCCGAGV